MLRKKEGDIFLERAHMKSYKKHSATISCGWIEEVIECDECNRMFIVIYISRVPEESGEHHHVAGQEGKEDVSVCPYCVKK